MADAMRLARQKHLNEKVAELGKINATVVGLEKQLGIPHGLPTLNIESGQNRIAELSEMLLAQKGAVGAGNERDAQNELVEAVAGEVAEDATEKPAASIPSALPPIVRRAKPEANLDERASELVTLTSGMISAAAFIKLSSAEAQRFCQTGGMMTRAEFNKLNPAMQLEFSKHDGKIVDRYESANSQSPIARLKNLEPKPTVDPLAPQVAGTMTRADFFKMTPQAQLDFVNKDGIIID